ncbi:MAG TPA: chloride channel protein [Gemmatimonadales bacterium]|nr:chloride channel protein [Gemmatimonadales bacterium]
MPSEAEHQYRDYTTDLRVLTVTVIATAIGILAVLAAVVLQWLIGFFTNLFYFHRLSIELVSPGRHPLGLWSVSIPVFGGLVVGFMARYGSEKIRGHGIPEAIEAVLIGRSRIEPKVAVLKPLSSAIAIGTGGPFGAEGPIIMTGGAVGSLVAQAFHLSTPERKTLLAAGASAGMAAIFATPVAAVLLAVELLLFEWKPRSFIPVAAAVAIAGALRVALLGRGPLFPVAPHPSLDSAELIACVGLGLAAGVAATAISAMVYRSEDVFRKLPIHWMWWPAIGGVVIGIGGLFFPRALGVGYDTIHDMLLGNLVGTFLLGLLVTKAVIWAVALGSGSSGGVLAPLLIMGGALGALEAHWFHGTHPGLWAAIGMGAMMASTMQVPLTAIVFIPELTGDLSALPALLIACVTGSTLTLLVMRHSILTEKLARRGQHVMREYIVNPLHTLCVADVMEHDVPTVPPDTRVDTLFHYLANGDPLLGRRQAWPIVDGAGHLVGIITRGDLMAALESADEAPEAKSVLEVGSSDLIVAYPDELLEQATARMLRHDVGRLPVVQRDDPQKLVGYLGRSAIMAAWFHVAREERDREPGWLSHGFGTLRGLLKRVIVRHH